MNLTLKDVVINEFVRFSNATPYRGVLNDMHIGFLRAKARHYNEPLPRDRVPMGLQWAFYEARQC